MVFIVAVPAHVRVFVIILGGRAIEQEMFGRHHVGGHHDPTTLCKDQPLDVMDQGAVAFPVELLQGHVRAVPESLLMEFLHPVVCVFLRAS